MFFGRSMHIYAQIVDDTQGQTLVAASTRDTEVRKTIKSGGNIAAAKIGGKGSGVARHRRGNSGWFSTGAAMPITGA